MMTKTEARMKSRSLKDPGAMYFWTRQAAYYRRFGGKPYYLLANTTSRKEAQIKANRWKRNGGHVRIVPFESAIDYVSGKRSADVQWLVYARSKRESEV